MAGTGRSNERLQVLGCQGRLVAEAVRVVSERSNQLGMKWKEVRVRARTLSRIFEVLIPHCPPAAQGGHKPSEKFGVSNAHGGCRHFAPAYFCWRLERLNRPRLVALPVACFAPFLRLPILQ